MYMTEEIRQKIIPIAFENVEKDKVKLYEREIK